MRAYTPMGCGLGYVDFVIKVYFANVHPKFPDGGKLTQILDSLKLGDMIDVKGPLGEYIFNTDITLPGRHPQASLHDLHAHADGRQALARHDRLHRRRIRHHAGAAGAQHALVADKEIVSISILFANRNIDDILCKGPWMGSRNGPARQGPLHLLDVPPSTPWKYLHGLHQRGHGAQGPPRRPRRP